MIECCPEESRGGFDHEGANGIGRVLMVVKHDHLGVEDGGEGSDLWSGGSWWNVQDWLNRVVRAVSMVGLN